MIYPAVKTNFLWALSLSIALTSVCTKVTANSVPVWPTENHVVSSPFGPRLKISDGFRFDFHRGIDIPGDIGDNIFATESGIVDNIYYSGSSTYPNAGNVVRLKHVGAYGTRYTIYMHLNSISVQKNQAVQKGAVIGTLGATGDTNLPHLHFEVLNDTPCSLQSQLAGGCSLTATGVDPHMNPAGYLLAADYNAPTVEVLQTDPLVIRVFTFAQEIDFNRLEVVDSTGEYWVLDYGLRTGFNASSVSLLDAQTTNANVTIQPGVFRTSSYISNDVVETTFRFNDVSGFRTIKASDIWGNSTVSSRMVMAPIFLLLND